MATAVILITAAAAAAAVSTAAETEPDLLGGRRTPAVWAKAAMLGRPIGAQLAAAAADTMAVAGLPATTAAPVAAAAVLLGPATWPIRISNPVFVSGTDKSIFLTTRLLPAVFQRDCLLRYRFCRLRATTTSRSVRRAMPARVKRSPLRVLPATTLISGAMVPPIKC